MPLDRDLDIPDVLRPGFPSSANARLSLRSGLGVVLSPTLQKQPTTTIKLISNANFDCGAGKKGSPQLEPFKTMSVFGDDLKTRKHASEDKNGTTRLQPFKTTSVFNDARKRVRIDTEDKNGTPQLQPLKTTSVFGDDLKARKRVRMDTEDNNGTPQQQPFKTTSVFGDDLKARKRVRMDTEDKNGTPQHQSFKTTSVFVDDLKAGKRARMDYESGNGTLQMQPFKTTSVFGDDLRARKRARIGSDGKNGTPQLQPFKTTSDDLKAPKRARMDTEGPVIDKNGTPQLFKTTSACGDDLKARKHDRMDSEGKNGTPQLQPDMVTSVVNDIGKRARMDSEDQLSVLEGEQKKSGQKKRAEREQEAIRKKLEANRARRRSSVAHGVRKSGRISTGRPSVLVLGKPKPKPSRVGFLSSAKSLVQSAWNRGKAPAPSIAGNIPKPTVTNVNASTKPAASKSPSSLDSKKRSYSTTASGSRIPVPVKNQRISSSDSSTLASANSIQQPLTGRKPRISRSKVMAKLALQRAAREGNESNATCGNGEAKLGPRASSNYTSSGRTRSSTAKVSRASYGGGAKSRVSGEERVLLSAKRRAMRQSGHARRKSKVIIAPLMMDGRYPAPMVMDGRNPVPSGM